MTTTYTPRVPPSTRTGALFVASVTEPVVNDGLGLCFGAKRKFIAGSTLNPVRGLIAGKTPYYASELLVETTGVFCVLADLAIQQLRRWRFATVNLDRHYRALHGDFWRAMLGVSSGRGRPST
ncbi:MAG: hypothetical protein H6733_07840 [Alphaproteobacteria bacterium]|nr:hypothetical protein [Alphaproteobacteria bacterium]